MPHFHHEILVVTYDELIPRFYSSQKVLSVTLKRAEKRGYGLKRSVKGGNGRIALIEYDSLSKEVKEQIPDLRLKRHILESFYKTDSKAVEFFQNYQFDDLTYLSDDIQDKYIINSSILSACHELKIAREYEITSKGFRPTKIYQTLCADAKSFNKVLVDQNEIEHTLPSNYLRFKETMINFKKKGYKSLISKKHKNKNGLKVDEAVVDLLNSMFADKDTKPSYIEVSRQYEAFLSGYTEIINNSSGEIYDPKSFPKLSQATIRNYLSAWENKSATHAIRSGNRQIYMNDFRTYHSHRKTEYAGTIISVDDRQPPFWYNENRKRVWFYIGYDDGSECFTVWTNDTTKEGLIDNFYRQMVRNYHEWGFNLPLELECEASLNSNYKEGLLKSGKMFTDVSIHANSARSKIIERKFGQLRYGFEKKRAGWLGRPSAKSETNQPGANQMKSEKQQMLPYSEIVEASLKDIETWNNSPHSKHPEISRWEYFCTKQNPDTKPINWRGILPYIGYKTRTSCKVGTVKLQKQEWLLGNNNEIYFGDKLIKLYQQIEGKDIDVYWLDGNDKKVMKALIYINNQFICEALPKPLYARGKAEQTEEDLKSFEIMAKYIATIDGYINRTKKHIDKILLDGEKPQTISNTFSITKAKVIKSNDLENKEFDNKNIIIEEKEVEILEDIIEDDDNLDYVSDNNNLFDRF